MEHRAGQAERKPEALEARVARTEGSIQTLGGRMGNIFDQLSSKLDLLLSACSESAGLRELDDPPAGKAPGRLRWNKPRRVRAITQHMLAHEVGTTYGGTCL